MNIKASWVIAYLKRNWPQLLAVLLVALLHPHLALPLVLLTSTGNKAPTVVVSSVGVTNPNNILVNDANYTNYTAVNQIETVSTFGLGVPVGMTINGITVQTGQKITGAGVNHSISAACFNKSTLNGFTSALHSLSTGNTTETTLTTGSISDLWGTSWVDTDFSDVNFQLRLTCGSFSVTSIDVDWVTVAVEYSVAGVRAVATTLLLFGVG